MRKISYGNAGTIICIFFAISNDVVRDVYTNSTDVLNIAHQIRARQATLVVQLHEIYPISYVGAGEYCIGGIKFMNSDISNGTMSVFNIS